MKPVRAIVGTVCAGLLLIVGFVVVRNVMHESGADCTGTGTVTEVRGIVGSEKEAFLRSPQVTEIFRCAGLALRIDPSGSREMVNILKGPRQYDFAFPSSAPAARKIMEVRRVGESLRPFSSVMGVATYPETVDLLRANGVVQKVAGTDVILVRKLVELAQKSVRWRQLAGNESSPNGNVVLMRTTDPADSNSAIMFLSIVSAVLNGDSPVAGPDALPAVMPELCRLMAYQGQKPPTSEILFGDYLTGGPSRIPMAFVYESQFYDRASSQQVPRDGKHVMLFPSPTVYARHTLVPFTDAGSRVGQLLRDDPELQDIAVRYGFRPEGRPMTDRANPPVVVEPPGYNVLEAMLDQLDRLPSFNQQTRKCAK